MPSLAHRLKSRLLQRRARGAPPPSAIDRLGLVMQANAALAQGRPDGSSPVPQAIFIGMENAGKTSAVEAMLGFPASVVGGTRTTTVATRFCVLRDREDRVRVSFGDAALGLEHTTVSTTREALALELQRINERIAEAASPAVSSGIVEVEVRTTDPAAIPLTFVDLPGLLSNKDNPACSAAYVAVADVCKHWLQNLGPEDVVVFVSRAVNSSGGCALKSELGKLGLGDVAPSVVLFTQADVALPQGSSRAEVEAKVADLRGALGHAPVFFAALHHLTDPQRSGPPDSARAVMREQLRVGQERLRLQLEACGDLGVGCGVTAFASHVAESVAAASVVRQQSALEAMRDEAALAERHVARCALALEPHGTVHAELARFTGAFTDECRKVLEQRAFANDRVQKAVHDRWRARGIVLADFMAHAEHAGLLERVAGRECSPDADEECAPVAEFDAAFFPLGAPMPDTPLLHLERHTSPHLAWKLTLKDLESRLAVWTPPEPTPEDITNDGGDIHNVARGVDHAVRVARSSIAAHAAAWLGAMVGTLAAHTIAAVAAALCQVDEYRFVRRRREDEGAAEGQRDVVERELPRAMWDIVESVVHSSCCAFASRRFDELSRVQPKGLAATIAEAD